MSDLISRSEVMNIIESELKLHCGYQADIALFAVKKQVSNLLTAYDVDKVVTELEKELRNHTGWYNLSLFKNVPSVKERYEQTKHVIERLIEIVKAGGKRETN